MIYQPKNSIIQKAGRRLRRFQNRRMIDIKTDAPIITVTFDDFPKTAASVGAPMLEAKGWRGTYYTSAKLEGTTNHHGPQFDRTDVITLDKAGHEIAGHSYDHSDLSEMSLEDVIVQVKDNKAKLAEYNLSQSIDNFAYPFGAASASLKQLLQNEYRSMRGIRADIHQGRADLNELSSFGFYSDTAQSVIDRVHAVKDTPTWMTLFTHDIQDAPTPWGCTEGEFQALLDAIESSGARVMTIRQALAYFGEQNDKIA